MGVEDRLKLMMRCRRWVSYCGIGRNNVGSDHLRMSMSMSLSRSDVSPERIPIPTRSSARGPSGRKWSMPESHPIALGHHLTPTLSLSLSLSLGNCMRIRTTSIHPYIIPQHPSFTPTRSCRSWRRSSRSSYFCNRRETRLIHPLSCMGVGTMREGGRREWSR